MCKTAYIFNKIGDETLAWIRNYGCEKILTDIGAHERNRPKLRQAIAELNSSDELIIGKLSNAVRGVLEMTLLLEICRLKGLRLISVEDKLDTGNELFQQTSSEALLTIMGQLPLEVNELRREVEVCKPDIEKAGKTNSKLEKVKRNVRVINMYLAGYSLQGISEQMKICRTSVYYILKRNGIAFRRTIGE